MSKYENGYINPGYISDESLAENEPGDGIEQPRGSNRPSLLTAIESQDADEIINILSQMKIGDRIQIGDTYANEFDKMCNGADDDVKWLIVKNLVTPQHTIRANGLYNALDETAVAEILAPLANEEIRAIVESCGKKSLQQKLNEILDGHFMEWVVLLLNCSRDEKEGGVDEKAAWNDAISLHQNQNEMQLTTVLAKRSHTQLLKILCDYNRMNEGTTQQIIKQKFGERGILDIGSTY